MLGDLASTLFGGNTNLLFTLSFSLEKPRQALIRLDVARQGIGSSKSPIMILFHVNFGYPVWIKLLNLLNQMLKVTPRD